MPLLILNDTGNIVASDASAGFRYRGKFNTRIEEVSGESGDEYCRVTLSNVGSPLVFIGGNSVKVAQVYQQQDVGSSTCTLQFSGPSGTDAPFTGYVFDLPWVTGAPGVSVARPNGDAIAVTSDWTASFAAEASFGLQAFDENGLKVFDAFNFSMPIVDFFTLDSSMAATRTYSAGTAALDLAMGYLAVDTGSALYQLNRQAFAWSSNQLTCSPSAPGNSTTLDPEGAPLFRAPVIAVINTAGL